MNILTHYSERPAGNAVPENTGADYSEHFACRCPAYRFGADSRFFHLLITVNVLLTTVNIQTAFNHFSQIMTKCGAEEETLLTPLTTVNVLTKAPLAALTSLMLC